MLNSDALTPAAAAPNEARELFSTTAPPLKHGLLDNDLGGYTAVAPESTQLSDHRAEVDEIFTHEIIPVEKVARYIQDVGGFINFARDEAL